MWDILFVRCDGDHGLALYRFKWKPIGSQPNGPPYALDGVLYGMTQAGGLLYGLTSHGGAGSFPGGPCSSSTLLPVMTARCTLFPAKKMVRRRLRVHFLLRWFVATALSGVKRGCANER
jgi:hypothetical protein